MRWPIIITLVAALFLILGGIAKLIAMGGGGLLFGLHPDAYLRFTELLILFAISIACIIKFKRG